MLEFHLFRMTVYLPDQLSLYHQASRPDVSFQAITSVPSAELRKGQKWHIGNVTRLDDAGLYFRVGRTSKLTVELYSAGQFTEQSFETAPYTHVVIDHEIGLCALARKPKLSKTAAGIAEQMARLLTQASPAVTVGARFEFQPVSDPNDFIAQLRVAYEISKFWVTFSRPNPLDADEDFVKPMQRLAAAADADRGKTELKGRALSPASLESVARSAAATGDDAGAWLKPHKGQHRVRRSLRSNPAVLRLEDVDASEPLRLLDRVRTWYRSIRGTKER